MPEASHSDDGTPSKDPLASLAMQIQYLQRSDRGTVARLRRFNPAQDETATLFETERLLHKAGVLAQGAARARWALVLHCLALVQGKHTSAASASTGAALLGLGVSEARLKQLLEADAETLAELMPRLARRVAADGTAMDWWPLAELLLYTGTDEEHRADRARRRLAEAFVRAESRASAAAADSPAT